MIRRDDCYHADEFEALLLRHRRGCCDHDDPTAWEDLGTLVRRLMSICHRASATAADDGPYQPTRVFQYWDQPSPPEDVADCMSTWLDCGAPVETFDRAGADAFLLEHFGGDVLAAFRHAHHPAMQADLFRLASLYQSGGLYVDADDAFHDAGDAVQFNGSAAVMPLAVSRANNASLKPIVDDPASSEAWYYLGNAPMFSVPGHPLVERALDRAVAAVTMRRREGELSQIHRDTGPGSFSMAVLEHVLACFRNDLPITLSIVPDWRFVEQSRDLGYKRTGRNWRTNAVLYSPAMPIEDPERADGGKFVLAG